MLELRKRMATKIFFLFHVRWSRTFKPTSAKMSRLRNRVGQFFRIQKYSVWLLQNVKKEPTLIKIFFFFNELLCENPLTLFHPPTYS